MSVAFDPTLHDPATCEREPCRRCAPSLSTAPPIDPDQHEHQGPTPPPDPAVRSIGLPRHPSPHAIAAAMREAARRLEKAGDLAVEAAYILAQRGYPASTLGDGGSRGTDGTSSTERTVQRAVPGKDDQTRKALPLPPDAKWWGVDARYATLLATANVTSNRLVTLTNDLLHHAGMDDSTPAGTGECRGCARICRPSKDKPGDRLRAGLCPTCYRAWLRYVDKDGAMSRPEWVARRRESYSERDPAGNLIAIHTPEPDHDIDLTTEKAPA